MLSFWNLSANTVLSSFTNSPAAGFIPRVAGDFNGDGRVDLILSDGRNMKLLSGTGTSFTSQDFGFYADGWQPFAAGDVDGDGRDDIIWSHPTGAVSYWIQNGNITARSAAFKLPAGYTLYSTGDFNADGKVDLLITNGISVLMWLGNGQDFPGYGFGSFADGWQLFASMDVDGDAISDLVWRHPSGVLSIWLLNANTVKGSFQVKLPLGYSPVYHGDFNGDNKGDLIISNGSNMLMWLGSGTAFPGYGFGSYFDGWAPLLLK
jgi:hypothetical protein